MKSQNNDGGGVTFILTESDSLDAVPESHRDIVTQGIREAFSDPRAYFRAIAERTSLPNLRAYLQKFVDTGKWMLVLADNYLMDRETVGAFRWFHANQHPSLIAPGSRNPWHARHDARSAQSTQHVGFSQLYDDIAFVHWDSIGFSGGIRAANRHIPLAGYVRDSHNPLFPQKSTTIFGNSSCGDMLVHNSHGQAGYLSHENGAAYVIGTIPETLDWIFGELIENRTPEFDYSRS